MKKIRHNSHLVIQVGIMIVQKLSKGRPSVSRLPCQYNNLVVLEECSSLSGSCKKGDMHLASYVLVMNVPSSKILIGLKPRKEINLSSSDFLTLINSKLGSSEFSCKNLVEIENEASFGFNFFIKRSNDLESRAVYNRVWRSSQLNYEQLCILVKSRNPFCSDESIEVTGIVFKDISNKRTLFCTNCLTPCSRPDKLKTHMKNPSACTIETLIKPEFKKYGAKQNIGLELYNAGFIRQEDINFKQDTFGCYDIETTEQLTGDESREKAILSCLSISFADSNDTKASFFYRKGETLDDGKNLISEFLQEIERKASEFKRTRVPAIFEESLMKMYEIENERREKWKKAKESGIPDSDNRLELFPVSWKQWLKNHQQYRIFGFNSSKFDSKVIAPFLFDIILSGENQKISVLKRDQRYINLTFQLNDCTISFRDILLYLSPCNLQSFLKMTGQPVSKGIFPYTYYSSISEIQNATVFPPIEAFHSDLSGSLTCNAESYNEAKTYFDNHCTTMLDYLRFYNDGDVMPLIASIKSWFKTFETTFGVDGYKYSSLASMSQGAMFNQYDEKAPYLFSFPPWKKSLLDKFRQSIVGGLTTVLHRCIDFTKSGVPDAAKFAPNGDEFSALVAWDFNSLYPHSLLQEQPTGPGIHWCSEDKDGNQRPYFVKKTLLPDSSLAELQYLNYLMYNDSRFSDQDGNPYTMEHAYFRDQKVIAGYRVDGYVMTPEGAFIIEFNGCHWHQPCPHTGCKFNKMYNASDLHSYEWYKKEQALQLWCSENNATLVVEWECQFNLKTWRNLETPKFPRIMRTFEPRNCDHIANLVLNDQLFGFCEVSLRSPADLIERYEHLNFPPIIRREKVTQDMLGSYMQERLSHVRKLPAEGVETVVNAYHCDKTLIFTPLLKWYLSLGLKIVECTDIIQYEKSRCFEKFISSCVKGRISATSSAEPVKAQTFKIAMNSR